MRRLESRAYDREQDAQRREVTDTMLGSPQQQQQQQQQQPPAAVGAGLEDPVALAERWAAAQQPGTDKITRVKLDKQVQAAGVDPDEVRAEHAATAADSSPEATPAGRTADTVQQQGVWQDGSPEVARAGLSYTRTPGRTITPGLTPQRRPRSTATSVAKTRDLDR